jgi:hypothetical protein
MLQVTENRDDLENSAGEYGDAANAQKAYKNVKKSRKNA